MVQVLIGILKDEQAADGERLILLSDNLEKDAQAIGLTMREYKITVMELNPQFKGVWQQDKYQFDDNGNEYWIGRDGKRHYTRNEG